MDIDFKQMEQLDELIKLRENNRESYNKYMKNFKGLMKDFIKVMKELEGEV